MTRVNFRNFHRRRVVKLRVELTFSVVRRDNVSGSQTITARDLQFSETAAFFGNSKNLNTFTMTEFGAD